jgi:hypothetical protein
MSRPKRVLGLERPVHEYSHFAVRRWGWEGLQNLVDDGLVDESG